ncbi:hypothetical protein C5F49_08830 [Nitrosopumilus oxyclinae]|uniref:PEFG-CTERM sorting domain-containing protein n=1 Tax=Nitrosopumilus oxyclinae TaxID=1959104 RepID=A0A7D5M3M1_9ARCH|nr:hypothetical protein [Nitrosopumilus oxyclinae]QLH05415.1 hypothetical protein C5F49_08830 [Nitrosopumilus oxyclinae]
MKIIGIFIIILLVLIIPSATAQEFSIGEKANQKSVQVVIDIEGNIHVKHVVGSSTTTKQVELISGDIENLVLFDKEGNEQMLVETASNDSVLILPSSSDSIIEYDLKNVLLLKDNLWRWEFRYLQTTDFLIPEELDLIFLNDRPVYLDEKKGFSCHGCQIILEYAIDEPKNIFEVNWEDKKFLVEIGTFANIDNFEFDQPTKKISFDINDSNQFFTIVIPLELLWGPYVIIHDDKNIQFQDHRNNGTHVWINMRPDTVGETLITGTTVIPEFPIITPLAIGFLLIMIMPFVRKINLP